MAKKGDYDQSTRNFYRAMKIAEEIGEKDEVIEKAKVNFGMANANQKWSKHQTEVLDKLKYGDSGRPEGVPEEPEDEASDEDEEALDGTELDIEVTKLPPI